MSDDNYKKWMDEVNGYCASDFNLTTDDLPDFNWRTMFDDGMTAHEAYVEFIDVAAQELDLCDF